MKKIDIACIIDDDPIFVYGLKKLMKIANFCESFMIFNNGEEAINNLTPILESGKNMPSVILLDLNMPIMDGWQFLDEFIKIESHKKITIYIVSSSIDPKDKNRLKNYQSVSKFIIKPVTIDLLGKISKELIK
ncbi:transcriptional regulator [Tamlana sedimentorum]|uniref:Transcriptional regulator n=1 Tax=Neotamlana sedimentorum TaxID=1435349 RepID=A0A0D7WDM1_9FLAO|nr:response regulator [Tamlana sedimentorum]KJD35832.1 transcriptional regulator [Tamlana sedimentorum]